MSLTAALVLPVAFLSLASLAACSDDSTTTTGKPAAEAAQEEEDGPTPAEWMDQACAAVQDWFQEGIAGARAAFGDAFEAMTKGLDALRSAVLDAVDAQVAAAKAALARLDAIGPGPTDNGEDVLDLLRLAPQLAHDAYSDVRIQIEDLDLTDLAGAEAAFSALESDLEAAGASAEEAFSGLSEAVSAGYPPCLPV